MIGQPEVFSVSRLDRFLRERVPQLSGEPLVVPVAGGQSNPTFFVTYENRKFVLRMQPAVVLPSAHAVDREFRILTALADTDVPVPRTLAYCADRSVVGTPFYVMERLDGTVHPASSLAAAPAAARAPMYVSMIETLARLHAINPAAVGLEDYGRGSGYFSRQIVRWTKQYELSKDAGNRDLDDLTVWLRANVPVDEETTLVHGDFRIGNLMYHASEPRVIGVLDWELSTLGHPLADLAHNAAAYYMDPEQLGGIYGLDLAALEIPSESDYISRYVERTGRAPYTKFHMAFALFRFAVICEGVAARGRGGHGVSAEAAKYDRHSVQLARQAALVAEGTVPVLQRG